MFGKRTLPLYLAALFLYNEHMFVSERRSSYGIIAGYFPQAGDTYRCGQI